MDHDLAVLVEMFPNVPTQAVQTALESSGYVVDDACAMLLSDQQQLREDPEEQLQAMFPNINRKTIQQVYEEQGGSDGAVAELLNHSLLVEEEEQQQRAKEGEESRQSLKRTSSGPEQCVKTVRLHTDVSEAEAKQFSYRSSFNAVKAIITIIESHDDQSAPRKSDMPSPIEPKSNRIGGRVQASHGIAHANSFAALQPKNNIKSNSKPQGRYIYSKESVEGQELEDAIRSNLDLRSINPTFLRHTLQFYGGDLQRTLLLAVFILDHKAAHYTHKESVTVAQASDVSGFTQTQPRRRRSSTGSASPFNPTLWDDQCSGPARRMVQDIFINPRLDFHGFLCNDALLVLRACLDKWWMEELTQRELHNQKLSMSQVANVSPLKVITGRGIHSDNGFSKLKREIRKFLDKNNYKYLEDSAYFVVVGKKTR